jgi:hypothetical protein
MILPGRLRSFLANSCCSLQGQTGPGKRCKFALRPAWQGNAAEIIIQLSYVRKIHVCIPKY